MSFRRLRILLLLGVLAGVIGFDWLERFMVRGWRVPLDVQVIPINGDGSVLKTVLWSLKLRWWVYRQSGEWLPQLGRIRLFLLYHAPQGGVALEHSLGLQKGLIGVVHVFSDPEQAGQNNIVIAHEMLHTLGASDKYDAGGMPRYPEGYAEPHLPQSVARREAEIMAGRLLDGSGRVVMPPGLERCLIGPLTAYEIGLDAAFKRRFASPH